MENMQTKMQLAIFLRNLICFIGFLPVLAATVSGMGTTCDSDDALEWNSGDYNCDSKNSVERTKKIPNMTRMVKDGTTIIINATQKHSASVILSHGLGDTADGWADAAMELSKRLPHIRWILPTAPSNPVAMNGGMRMPSWYNIASLSTSRSHQQCEGIEESTATLISLVEKEKASGIDYSRIVLAGFSQGGAMSLWAGLQFASSHSSRLGGVVCMSGYLPKDHAFVISEHGKNTPVLHCHGSSDPLVLPSFAEESHQHILQAGHSAGYDLKMYRGLAHSANMQELVDIATWIASIVPPV